jgi:hypothetical protein
MPLAAHFKTIWRDDLSFARKIVTLVALTAACVAWWGLTHADSYVVLLIWFFILCLSIFHFILSIWIHITQTIARSTDYVYFTLAFIGLALAAFAQDRQRNADYAAAVSSMSNPSIERAQEIITNFSRLCVHIPWEVTQSSAISVFMSDHVLPERLDADTCHFLVSADSLLRDRRFRDIPGEVKQASNRLGMQAAAREMTFHFTLPLTSIRALYSRSLASAVFLQARLALEGVYFASPIYKDDNSTTSGAAELQAAMVKYAFSSVWPFVLALALSLRLTRVTADITNWPRSS